MNIFGTKEQNLSSQCPVKKSSIHGKKILKHKKTAAGVTDGTLRCVNIDSRVQDSLLF